MVFRKEVNSMSTPEVIQNDDQPNWEMLTQAGLLLIIENKGTVNPDHPIIEKLTNHYGSEMIDVLAAMAGQLTSNPSKK